MSQQQENKRDPEQAENLRVLLEQNWEHSRHIERERISFLFAYIASIATILGLVYFPKLAEPPINIPSEKWIFIVPIFLTLIALLLSIRWGQAFESHRKEVNRIIASLESGGHIQNMTIPKTSVFRLRIGAFVIFSTKYLFSYFYSIILVVIILLMSYF